MSDAYEVIRVGTDSSGRPVLMNRRMKAAWDAVNDRLDFGVTIVQGAYMSRVPGGGADASAGYHDRGGCIDTRTWDIDSREERAVIHVARSIGWAVWRRDQAHGGFDEHMHWVLLGDKDAASGALGQMQSYRNGGDGMGGSDYHWRPDPIPSFNYAAWPKEHDMPSVNDLLSAKLNPDEKNSETVRSALNKGADALAVSKGVLAAVEAMRENDVRRYQVIKKAVNEITREGATHAQVINARDTILSEISEQEQ